MDRLLLESDVIRTIDKHISDDNKLDNDITCILENVETASMDIPPLMLDAEACDERPRPMKEKRVQLFENDNLILEQRESKYYLSFFDDKGKFRREVTITLKDDYKVTTFNGM